MLVIGEKEVSQRTVSVRQHKKGDLGSMEVNQFLGTLTETIKNKSLTL